MTEKPGTEGHPQDDEIEAVAKEAEHLLFSDMAQYMSQFARSFEASARRWELVVYPSLLAFIILAAYGFFLIYRLTTDISTITGQVGAIAESMVNINRNFSSTTNNMNTMTRNILKITDNMETMTGDITEMTGLMARMSNDIEQQNRAMGAIVVSMEHMNQSIDSMSFTMYQMRYDTSSMGRNMQNATGPMRFMNNFVPW
ncbi:MAG: methyl-accepting chemotaxis protein [Thiogranum sp.]|nr:methyl-accepting chemotaxis protein [Thiogranum sp.]